MPACALAVSSVFTAHGAWAQASFQAVISGDVAFVDDVLPQYRFGAGTASLTFIVDPAQPATLHAELISVGAGAHRFTQASGSTYLYGDSSRFTGEVAVTGGTLRLRETLGSSGVTVGGVDSAGGVATLLLDTATSALVNTDNLSVGDTASGVLRVEGGGKVSNRFGSVLAGDGISATATVTGAGSEWNNANALSVRGEGAALSILAGGLATSEDGYIGQTSGTSRITVAGTGSAWHNSGFLRVGELAGNGILRIEAGGQVSNGDSYVGSMADTTGEVIVRGAGSLWDNTGEMHLGFGRLASFGQGSLTLAEGGTASVGAGVGTVRLGMENGLWGLLNASGTLNIGSKPGDAPVAPGVLEAAAVDFGGGAAVLNFNHDSMNHVFLPTLKSNGGLRGQLNQLAGFTRLDGDSTAFRGVTTVSGGTLAVASALGGSATVTGGRLLVDGVYTGDVTASGGMVAGAGQIDGALDLSGGGTLSGVQGQALAISGAVTMDADSVVNVSLGSGVPGALFDVGGDLMLDGTLHVADQGGFGAGVYRLFDYRGVLADNGLTIGTRPSGVNVGDLSIQASAGHVNLLAAAGAALDFWDGGNALLHDNGRVDGGDGTWRADGRNWTTSDGAVNGRQQPSPAFAVFQGTAGVVTADATAGPLGVTGMHLFSDGYRIQGDAIALQGTNGVSIIRVGDGTQASAGYVGTVASELMGASQLAKSDFGTLVLTGSNTYTGGTDLRAGTLQVSADANLGAADGALIFSGGTLATTGSFETGRAVSLAQAGTVDVAAGTALALTGVLSGPGALTKAGAGTLILAGDGSGFTGTSSITGGRLVTNGRLGGGLTVGADGILGGSGTVGSGAGSQITIADGGTLSPGNSIGTLTINGDLSILPGARFVVEVEPGSSAADLVRVTGNATLAGGSVAHVGAAGSYPLRTSHTILSAGTLSGRFDGVTSDFAFLMPSLAYDYAAGTVSLGLQRNGQAFSSAARTRNQRATAQALDSIGMAAGHAVHDAFAQLPDDPSRIQRSIDQLAAEVHASAKTALIEDSRIVRAAATDRLRAAFGDVALGVPVASSATATDTRAASWVQATGNWGRREGDGNAGSLKRSSAGFLMGVDAPVLNGKARLGVMAGYSRTDADVRGRAASARIDSYHLGVYGGVRQGRLGLRTGLAYGWTDLDTRRTVSMPGLSEQLKAGYDGGTAQAFADLGYRLDWRDTRVEPYVNVAHVRARTGSFRERGGAAAVHASSQSESATFATLGARASSRLAFGDAQVDVHGALGWRHAFGAVTPVSTQAFSAGSAYTVAGAPIARNGAVVETGLAMQITRLASLGVAYQGQLGGKAREHGLNARVNVRF